MADNSASNPRPEPEWVTRIQTSAPADSKPLLDLVAISKDCVWMDQTQIHMLQGRIARDRGEDIDGLGLDENSACVRIEADLNKLKIPIKDMKSKIGGLDRIFESLYSYIPRFVMEPDSDLESTPQSETQSRVRCNYYTFPPDKAVFYIDFRGEHAAADAMTLYELINANLDRAHTPPTHSVRAVKHLRKGMRLTIEQRAEQITQSCLEEWLMEVNNRIQTDYKPTQPEEIAPVIPIAALQPKPLAIPTDGSAPKGAKIQGLYGVALGMVTRAMAGRESLELSDADRQKLEDITYWNDANIMPHDEAKDFIKNNPVLKKIEGLNNPTEIYGSLSRSVAASLETYFTNKPLRNDPPPRGGAQR